MLNPFEKIPTHAVVHEYDQDKGKLEGKDLKTLPEFLGYVETPELRADHDNVLDYIYSEPSLFDTALNVYIKNANEYIDSIDNETTRNRAAIGVMITQLYFLNLHGDHEQFRKTREKAGGLAFVLGFGALGEFIEDL